MVLTRRGAASRRLSLDALPSELLQIIWRKCSALSLCSLLLTNKALAILTKQQATLLLKELCAAATTSVDAAAIGGRSIQLLARVCGLRPQIPFDWCDAALYEVYFMCPGSIGNTKTDLEALELLFLVFHSEDLRSQNGTRTPYFQDFLEMLMTHIADDEAVPPFMADGARCDLTVELAQRCLLQFAHQHGASRRCFRRTRRLMRMYENVEDEDFGAPDVGEDLYPDIGDVGEDSPDIGVLINGEWYQDLASFFDVAGNCPDVREDHESIDWGSEAHLADACNDSLCCHMQCNCRLANHITESFKDSRRGYRWFVSDKGACMRALHQARRRRPAACCPRVRDDRLRLARYVAWRTAGHADPRAQLARQGAEVIEDVRLGDVSTPAIRVHV